MKVCPKCGRKWPDKAKFCPVDGGLLVSEEEKSESKPEEARPRQEKKFSETKWFMIGDHIKEEDVTPEDIPEDDLQEVYKKTAEIPPELRKKYSLSYKEKGPDDQDDGDK